MVNRFFRGACVFLGCLLILSSCNNFMSSGELIDIYFSSPHGKISPNGKMGYKVKDKINLMFTEKLEWQFVKWQILDQNNNDVSDCGYISINDKENSTTLATFEKEPANGIILNIIPQCASRPKVISCSPSMNTTGVPRDAEIKVSFDQNIHQDSIYFTDKEVSDLKKIGVTDFLKISSMENDRIYGYKKADEIFYKNIKIYNKDTGMNLLEKYGEPKFEGNNTLVLPTKSGEDAPLTGTQIVVELKDFFYELNDKSLQENRTIKMNTIQTWNYSVN